jgi:hypothetical protein
MARLTYQVTLASDGKHAVTISGDDQQEVSDALAWARETYTDLVGPFGPRLPNFEDHLGDKAPICKLHDIPMVKQLGRKGAFWSCHQKNQDGSWCSYKPDTR